MLPRSAWRLSHQITHNIFPRTRPSSSPSTFAFQRIKSPLINLHSPNPHLNPSFRQTRHVQILLPPGRGGGGPRYQRFGNQPPHRPGFYLYHLWRTSPTFRFTTGALALGSGIFYVSNLETVPVSGRRRFNIISAETEALLAQSMYEGVLAEHGNRILPNSHPYPRLVRRVMDRLVPVSGLEDLNWEVYVIADESQKNAFVIPGGKVFVFSGILQLCGRGEDGLAAVLSHEISHTVAHHSAERMSQMFLVVGALWAVAVLLGGSDGGLGRILMDLVYLRPSSRKQEAEADYIGLMMMASACYDPERAVGLWQAMEKAEEFSPPQFLSTHPAHRTRIQNITEWLPEAQQKQATSDCAATMDYASEFRKVFDYHVW